MVYAEEEADVEEDAERIEARMGGKAGGSMLTSICADKDVG
jgi:hypothetical protein